MYGGYLQSFINMMAYVLQVLRNTQIQSTSSHLSPLNPSNGSFESVRQFNDPQVDKPLSCQHEVMA